MAPGACVSCASASILACMARPSKWVILRAVRVVHATIAYCAVIPPSSTSSAPVTKDASSEAR